MGKDDDHKPTTAPPDDEPGRQPKLKVDSGAPGPASKADKLSEFKKASQDLKARIADAKRKNDMPVDSSLGSPRFERDAADGRFDAPDDEDEKD
jgi:hypothetical protein